MYRLFTILSGVAIFSGSIIAQERTVTYLYDAGTIPENKVIDIQHLTAKLNIDPYDTLVEGSAVFSFTPVLSSFDSVIFWCPDIRFTHVEIPGLKIDFRKAGDNLVIINRSEGTPQKKELLELKMEYTSRPGYDLFFIGWNEPGVRPNKQIWAHRPFHWLPYCSDRLTVDMFITFEGKYQVFTNGTRESVKENNDGTKTWHYKMHKEHPFFSTCLVIGDYRYLERETSGGIPLELCYYPWQEDHAEPTYRYTELMFDFFENEFGVAYPYELYREEPVEDYLYGAMETTTATVFGDYLAVDDRGWDLRNYVNVNAHELAHQWYGDCLSHLRGADVWLTESFATYYAKMFEREVFGEDYYQNVRRLEFDEALEASKKDGYAVGHSRGGRARWYPKGSLVLDMLRDVMGEEAFKASVRHYTEKNLFSEVETGEFLSSIYEASGQSLAWFFDQWIFRGGEPKYQVSWHPDKTAAGEDQTTIIVKQVHPTDDLVGLFSMPVNFDVYYDDGSSERISDWIKNEYEEVHVANPGSRAVSFVLFDPGNRIFKTVIFDKSFGEWAEQALRAESMIDRYDALVALRNFRMQDKKDILIKAYSGETFHLTKGEIIRQMLSEHNEDFEDIIRRALSDEDPLVRRAALEYASIIPGNLQSEYEHLLKDRSYVNVEKALDVLSRSFPGKIPVYLETTRHETGWRGLNIRMKWLEIALGSGQMEYIGELVGYASPRYEFETRMNAFQLLKRLNYLDKTAAGYLIDGYVYWNYKVSNAAREVLLYFCQQNSFKDLVLETLDSGSWSTENKNKVMHIFGETSD